MIYYQMLLGHLVGDYLLQNNFMALNKSKFSLKGWFACIIHCIIYTYAVCLVMQEYNWLWIAIVFLSHFFIDKFSLAALYLKALKSRDLSKIIRIDKSTVLHMPDAIQAMVTIFVVIVADNTMHLLLMFYGYNKLFGF